MQRPSFELTKSLEENGDEGVYVLRRIFRRLDNFAIVGIRKANADRLIDEENIRMLIPGVFETLCRVCSCHATRS